MATKTPEDIVREADALIAEVQQNLAASAGLTAVSGSLTAEQKAEAERLFRLDMEAAEREVTEEAARLSFANAAPRTGGARKMRNMI